MDITYQIINSSRDKLKLYRFRKQVFVDEEKRWYADEDLITDLYDSIDETVNIAAVCNNKIVGALRITLESGAGFPGDRHWDFTTYRSRLSGLCVNFGWLCCTRQFRHKKGLIKTLVAKGAEQAKKKNARHLLSVIHPPVYEMLHKCFGVRQIGDAFQDPHLNLEMIPIHGRVDEILERQGHVIGHKVTDRTGRPDETTMTALGFRGRYHFLEQALSRNLGIFSAGEQERLLNSRVAIPGLGGVGGQHLITLARTGIGRFSLAEFDTFEAVNVNRQYGARVSSLGLPKLEIMVKDARQVNPYLDIRTFPEGITPENIDAFLNGADLVADGMDFFNIDIRRLIFTRARELSIPVVTAGPLGFSAALLTFMPDRGMDFDTYFNINDDQDQEEKLLRFFIGLAPKATQAAYTDPSTISMSGKKGPSTGAGCLICSAALAAEAVRILLQKKGIKPVPHYFQYDPFSRQFCQNYLPMGNRHPAQRIKIRRVKQRLNAALPLDMPTRPDRPDDTGQIINHLIDAGCQAPSGDNCQPWKLIGKENRIDLYLRPDADTCFFNFDQMASMIACGAAVENICQAATQYGLKPCPVFITAEKQPELMARIDLEKGIIQESPLARFIWTRHTNRTKFSGRPIPGRDLDALKKSLSEFPQTRLAMVRDKEGIQALSQLIYEADLIRSQRRDLHTHLMKMIRFSREEALATRDGLPLKNLEAGLLGEAFLKLARTWPHLAGSLSLGRVVARTAAQWTKQSSAMGLITVRGRDRNALMTGGRALERLWLTATAAGLSFQPMTAVTLFRERWDSGGQSDFTMPQQQGLGRIWPLFDHIFPVGPHETRIMLFRLGYGSPVTCRTLRQYQGSGKPKA